MENLKILVQNVRDINQKIDVLHGLEKKQPRETEYLLINQLADAVDDLSDAIFEVLGVNAHELPGLLVARGYVISPGIPLPKRQRKSFGVGLYDTPIPFDFKPVIEYGSVEDFKKCIKDDNFADNGYVHPAKENMMDVSIKALPPFDVSLIPDDATHIVWFYRYGGSGKK